MRSGIKKRILLVIKKKREELTSDLRKKLIKGSDILKWKHTFQGKKTLFTSLLYNLHLHFIKRTYKTSGLKCSSFP